MPGYLRVFSFAFKALWPKYRPAGGALRGLLVGLLCLAGCNSGVHVPGANAARGGTVVIGSYTKPDVLNPLLASSTVSTHIFSLLFDGLTRLTKDLTPAPGLASSWDVSPDGLTYTFHLRRGVLFHDGTEFTADDVKFTYDTARRPEYTPQYYNLDGVKRVDAVDRYTVRVVLTRAQPRFLTHAATFSIVPARRMGGGDAGVMRFNRHPVGTGPFRFDGWADSTRLSLTANDAYFGGRPRLDRVVFWTGLNQTALWARLMRGEIDVTPSLLPEDMEIVKVDSTTFRLYSYLDPFYYTLSYNLDNPLFADRRVRRAFAYALDRRAIVDRALAGHGALADGPFLPDSWAYNPEVRPFPYDPPRALRLLAEAGWIDRDGDGVLDRGGKPFVAELLIDTGDRAKETTALLIRQQLQEIGVRIRLKRLNADRLMNERMNAGRFDVTIMQYNAGQAPATASVFWHSRNIAPGRLNLTRYRNAGVDRLFDLGAATPDPGRQQDIYRRVHALIMADQPAAFLYFKNRFEGVNRRIGGIERGPGFGRGYNLYRSIPRWHIRSHS